MNINVRIEPGYGAPALVRSSMNGYREYRDIGTGLRYRRRIVVMEWIPF